MKFTQSTTEIWIPIAEFKNYFVSSRGRIKTKDFNHTGTERIIKLFKNVNGYNCCNLMMNGKRKRETVHQLVARAFIDNPERHRCINHINGVKDDNNYHNLEWCTSKHNTVHAIVNNLGADNRRGSDLSNNEISAIRFLLHKEVNSKVVSKAFKISYPTLKRLKNEFSRSSQS